jgi:hypothetical protein
MVSSSSSSSSSSSNTTSSSSSTGHVWHTNQSALVLLLGFVHAGETRAKTLDKYRNIGIMAHIDAGKVIGQSGGGGGGGRVLK